MYAQSTDPDYPEYILPDYPQALGLLYLYVSRQDWQIQPSTQPPIYLQYSRGSNTLLMAQETLERRSSACACTCQPSANLQVLSFSDASRAAQPCVSRSRAAGHRVSTNLAYRIRLAARVFRLRSDMFGRKQGYKCYIKWALIGTFALAPNDYLIGQSNTIQESSVPDANAGHVLYYSNTEVFFVQRGCPIALHSN